MLRLKELGRRVRLAADTSTNLEVLLHTFVGTALSLGPDRASPETEFDRLDTPRRPRVATFEGGPVDERAVLYLLDGVRRRGVERVDPSAGLRGREWRQLARLLPAGGLKPFLQRFRVHELGGRRWKFAFVQRPPGLAAAGTPGASAGDPPPTPDVAAAGQPGVSAGGPVRQSRQAPVWTPPADAPVWIPHTPWPSWWTLPPDTSWWHASESTQ